MSEPELHALIADLFRDLDQMVEFWMTGTFAVLVARFVAGDRLSRGVVRLMAFLYVAASGLSFGRYMLAAGRSLDYRSQLVTSGLDDIFYPAPIVAFTFFCLCALYTVGTGATVYCLLGRVLIPRSDHPAADVAATEAAT